jgi:hypothetical protein
MHTPQPTPLETQETPFQSPFYIAMVDAIKASSGSIVLKTGPATEPMMSLVQVFTGRTTGLLV